jgi:hydrogenase maturation protease
MKTLIIGLGNPILGDDGVGWVVAQEVEKILKEPPSPALPPFSAPPSSPPNFAWISEIGGMEGGRGEKVGGIKIECLALAGIALMEQMVGYERVVLVDSLNTGQHAQGEVVTFSLDSLEDLLHGHSASAHDLSLKSALKLGRSMGADLPRDENIQIVAIEAAHVYDFTEELTPAIAAAVPVAVKKVLDLLELQEGEKI